MKLELIIQLNVSMKLLTVYHILQKLLLLQTIILKMFIMLVALVPSSMSYLKKPGAINGDCLTVSGKTIRENVAGCEILDKDVIHPLDNPHSERGGLAVLFGNLSSTWFDH